jgi:hypothetical protein
MADRVAPVRRCQALFRRYRDSSQTQFTSQVFPPSAENECSMRAECAGRPVSGEWRDAIIKPSNNRLRRPHLRLT